MTEHPAAPTTEAGQSFLRWMSDRELWHPIDGRRDVTTGYVAAIEAEARAAGYRDCAIRTLEAIRRDRNIPEGDPLLTILVPDSLSTNTREEPTDA